MNKSPLKIVLAGGSGFLGRHLAAHFHGRGHEVVILTRHPAPNAQARELYWHGRLAGPWQAELANADILINLAGKNVNCRYTPEAQREIIDSRCDSVHILGETLRGLPHPPRLWIQAGSLAIFGDTGSVLCDEDSATGLTTGRRLRLERFPVEVCERWEAAFRGQAVPGVRQVLLRIGFVLGRDEGALGFLATLTRGFLGGTVLPGTQYVSWIHIEDFIRLAQWILDTPSAEGVYNATGPQPVAYRDFMRDLRRALHRPWSPPVPVWATHCGTWLLRSEPALALAGRRCVSKRLAEAGFTFRHTQLFPALKNLYPA